MAAKEREKAEKLVCQNRRARRDYFIEETYEAGIALRGSEVKSLRDGRANLADSYAVAEGGELWLLNSQVSEYPSASRENHEPRRPRKLLLHKQEIRRLVGKIEEKGYALIPLSIYFNERGIAKVQLGLGKGKKQYDKREVVARRDAEREMERAIKSRRG